MFLVSMGVISNNCVGWRHLNGQYRACIIRIVFFVFFFHYQLIRTAPFSMYFLAFVFPLLYIYVDTKLNNSTSQ